MRKGTRHPQGQYRIIAGKWRGRRIPVIDQPGLRPTPDRVRETVFNWLAPLLPGCRCLDLFAGAGALGLEAASRGAAQVVMVDSSRPVVVELRAVVEQLRADTIELVQSDALAFLRGPPEAFDVVFLDPPYAAHLLESTLRQLHEGWLSSDAVLYLEHAVAEAPPELPEGWEYHRSKRTSQVGYHLVQCRA